MSLPLTKQRPFKSRSRRPEPLPDIYVPPLHRIGAPLTMLPGKACNLTESSLPFSARATFSATKTTFASSVSSGLRGGTSVGPCSSSSRCTTGVGSRCASAKCALEKDRKAMSTAGRMPSSSSTCRSFMHPYSLDILVEQPPPPKSALPGLMRERSWVSVNPPEEDSPKSKCVAAASRCMAKDSDPSIWVKEMEIVEEAAKEVRLPNTRVTALALDALTRFAKVVPAQEKVISDLIGRIDEFIYPQNQLAVAVDAVDGVEDLFDEEIQEEIQESSDSDSSNEGSCSHMRMINFSHETVHDGSEGNPWSRYMRKLDRSDLLQENWLAVLEESPSHRVASSETISRERRGAFKMSLTEDPLKIKAASSWVPPRYAERMPFFFIDRKQRWDMKESRDRLRWMHEICTSIEGQQRAQIWLFDYLHEMTFGKLLNWVWAFWKAYFMEIYIFQRQVTEMKSTQRFLMGRVLLTWRHVAINGAVHRKNTEDAERRDEMNSLQTELANVESVLKELHIALEISAGGAQRLESQRQKAEVCVARYRKQFDLMQPQVVKDMLYRLLSSMLENSTILAGTGHIACKATLLSKDFSHLVAHDDDTRKGIGKLSCEDIVIRWINYLLVEVKYCAADLLEHAGLNAVSDTRSAWSSKDAPIFGNRCRRIRAVYFVEHLGEDLKDGTVLIALCAMIRAHRHGHSIFDPADLWPLDVRDADARLEAVCCCAHAVAPTHSAKCILRRQDIANGNEPALLEFLAALLLVEAPGLDKVVEKSETHSSRDTKQLKNAKDLLKGSVDGFGEDDEIAPLLSAYNKLYEEGLHVALEHSEDPSRLLRQDEQITDLLRMSAEEVLIRWVNCHIADDDNEGIKNMCSDLRDGTKLLALLRKVAPDVLKVAEIAEDLAPDLSIQAVVQCAPRCVDPCSLTVDAIRSGSEDLLIGFLGNLFIGRPVLQPQDDSKLSSHLSLASQVYEMGHTVSQAGKDENNSALFLNFCRSVEKEHGKLFVAVDSLLNARRVMERLKLLVDAHIVKIFSQRAKRGLSSVVVAKKSIVLSSNTLFMVHAKIVDYPFMSTDPVELNSKRVRDVVQGRAPFLQEFFDFYAVKLSDSEPRLPFEGIMRIYTSCKLRCPCVGVPPFVAEAIYYDVLEHDLPACRQGGEERSEKLVLEGLSLRGFVRWVLRIAIYKYEREPDEREKFHINLGQFFERHLEPHACQVPKDDFGQMTHSKPIRAVFMAREFILHAIFESYAVEVGDKESLPNARVTYEDDEKEGRERLMDVGGFIRLISDAGLMRGNLTEQILESLFMNVIKQGGLKHNGIVACDAVHAELITKEAFGKRRFTPAPTKLISMMVEAAKDGSVPQPIVDGHKIYSSEGDVATQPRVEDEGDVATEAEKQSSVAFFQFLHCLLAVVLYTNPNPMLAAPLRVEQFLADKFLPGLIAHVESIPTSEVDGHPYQMLFQALTDIDKADDFCMIKRKERRNFLQRGLIGRRGTMKEAIVERRASSADGNSMLRVLRPKKQVALRRPKSQSPRPSRTIL